MFVRPMSDLHVEFSEYRYKLPVLNHTADEKEVVLLLLGDIGCGSKHKEFIHNVASRHRAVIYVPGNHEYYSRDCMQKIDQFWVDEKMVLPNLFYLNPGFVEIDDVTFIGGALWTDMLKGDFFVRNEISRYMNDYNEIKWRDPENNYRKLRTIDVLGMNVQQSNYIRQELDIAEGRKAVVCTHHCPTFAVAPRRDRHDDCDYAFYNTTLDDVFFRSDAPTHWFYGHTHEFVDKEVGKTRIMSNPRGYDIRRGLVTEFNPHLLVNI